jgi:ferritin-like metal-binding protein YciE
VAMEIYDYFRTRCANTLEVVQNLVALFDDLQGRTQHPELREIAKDYFQNLSLEEADMTTVLHHLGETHPTWQLPELQAGERLVIVGRGWVGMVETHRVFIGQIAPQLIDINTALVMEEATHFNQGNYTGLIVLAKHLGYGEIATLLQSCIDREVQMRTRMEGALWWVVGDLQGEVRKAA